MEEFINNIINWATTTGIKIVIALVILIVAFKLINFLFKKLEKRAAEKGKLDKTVESTLVYAGRVLAKCVVVVALIGYLGIDTSGFAAVIASLGVCIGLAVNGALANFAGGILLLITRPFKVDDFIETSGFTGTVEAIHLTNTKLRTLDNRVVYIANGGLSGASIVNYSEKDLRRVDHVFSVSYESDFEKAKTIINQTLASHAKILDNPGNTVRVVAHNASSVDICCRAWVKSEDYWDVYFDLLEQIKHAFDANGIEIPYQQMDVHVKNA